jgi:hypothetical protein
MIAIFDTYRDNGLRVAADGIRTLPTCRAKEDEAWESLTVNAHHAASRATM